MLAIWHCLQRSGLGAAQLEWSGLGFLVRMQSRAVGRNPSYLKVDQVWRILSASARREVSRGGWKMSVLYCVGLCLGLPERSSSMAAAVSLMIASEAILCYFYNILGYPSPIVWIPGGGDSQGLPLRLPAIKLLLPLPLWSSSCPFKNFFLMWALLRVFV